MHDLDDPPPEKRHPIAVSKMSKTPSWVMLGFILGALFMYWLDQRAPATPPASPPAPAPVVEKAPEPERKPPPLSRIEAVFEDWGKYAKWSDDTTEVALWAPETSRFSDFYEVRRANGNLYFRSIPEFTRRPIVRSKPYAPTECPLEFTETEDQYRDWYEHARVERPAIERMWEKPLPPPLPRVTAPVAPEIKPVRPAWETPALPPPSPTGEKKP